MKDFFPVGCGDSLSKIGLLVKAKRVDLGLRQTDLKTSLGISEHTLRKIENGSEHVDLRSFMLVLWRLGISEMLFSSLEGIENTSQMIRYAAHQDAQTNLASKRVRLSKPKAEDF
ncbi:MULTISPECIES: helix-turn-helix domain-containing protein [unclassified Pseudomonas]|uniref:helix-turn-helix domain-containing protein n=1 Tax=unclassified Pseudomonas TaxID=196821 RepID=UPI002AC8FC86|nr:MULTISPECIES: helix-turn-helix domain-containing protein [unclassified Pseudomonas]MEB0039498.1 helix-turn-helix domain-containing protein [Pseudomonas sp. MH10]MEB0077773.1 helix-turn-helix domain-containing protein [Pseudomonas sp. MH10out]MEB0092462.1 helix-turn-helix domain-containing protein [Pseudomonas sp. CCI4.2]MEB0103098.1 helix-turn-helix domain-containing protein [Pseudomonas sp. CCI3.2]MEB0122353.1 helix-turn-helix domain-containing protein [Pseudomonas sp. CCI1.2]